MKFLICWHTNVRPNRVATAVRGLARYNSPEAAQAQVDKYRQVFPANRYQVEPA